MSKSKDLENVLSKVSPRPSFLATLLPQLHWLDHRFADLAALLRVFVSHFYCLLQVLGQQKQYTMKTLDELC